MAISRVTGPIIKADLDRQGVDLQFTTNNEPLLYLDFANFRVGINANLLEISETLTVNGNLKLSNIKIDAHTISSDSDLTLSTVGNLHLGNLSNVKITGGTANYILTTDGAGNLTWQDLNAVSSELHLSGMNVILGTVSDSSVLDHSAYRRWTANTTVSDASDHLNQVMLNVYMNTYVGNASFISNVSAGPSPLPVQFTSTVFGNPNAYYWDFGDGNTSILANPQHTFSNVSGGTYTVYFKAYNTGGTIGGAGALGNLLVGNSQGSYFDSEVVDYITLYTPAPIPSFTLSANSINNGASIQLTNTSQDAQSYEIDWGDGTNDLIPSNAVPGGVGGGAISHTYNNVLGDTLNGIVLHATSPTAGPSGLTITSTASNVRVYSGHVPAMSANVVIGNNQHATLPHGLMVGFLNNTATQPGVTSIFANNRYEFNFDDSTHANVNIGSSNPGDTNLVIAHAFTLTDPTVQQVFNANLQVFNGNTNSPFTSVPVSITVKPAPTSLFTANATVTSDRTGDTAQTGYLFTDLNGANRAQFTFTNNSFNTNVYTWSYGDTNTLGPIVEGVPGTPTGGTVDHSYTAVGNKTVSLEATGPNSLSPTDDSLTQADYLTVLTAPAAPADVSTKVLTVTSIGSSPLMAANATNNSTVSLPTAGNAVIRITNGGATTNTLTNVYDSAQGAMNSIYNGVAETTVTLDLTDNSGTYGALVITQDRDAHLVDAATYPSNFYKVFDGHLTKANAAIAVGHNTLQLTHTTAGTTPVLSFVKDDVTSAPSLDVSAVTMSTSAPGTLRYISGVPYFNTGGSVSVQGAKAYNWIGQCYVNTATPLSIHLGTVLAGSGTIMTTQGKSYADLNGNVSYLTGGIPNANTGNTISNSYTLGTFTANINGSAALSGKIDVQLSNVNGASVNTELPTLINLYSIAITGLDELNIPVSPTLGSGYTDNGKRVALGASGATPVINNTTNYYTFYPFGPSTVVAGTDEAILRFGSVLNDVTDYSSYLPVGPNLSGRTGTQYFRFAFRRQTMADFNITYSGKISGMWISSPGTEIDNTSTLNGWVDAAIVYAGAGIPGANAIAGGNGSNGCAKTAGDVVPVGTTVTNKVCTLTLGSENASNATGNQILVTIAIASGDSLTSVSVS